MGGLKKMSSAQQTAEIEQATLELIICTRQPGKLRISRHACALRYLLAHKGKIVIPEDEFGMARKAGLDKCRDCPEGRVFSERFLTRG
jgi:hypothetical protein